MVNQTFRPEFRLRFSWQYQRFYKNPKSEVLRLGVCTVFRLPNEMLGPRLGMSIKTNQGSVVRNRIKRKIRELYRCERSSLGNYDYNIVVSQKGPMQHLTPEKVVCALKASWASEGRYVPARR